MTTMSPHVCFVPCTVVDVDRRSSTVWIVQGDAPAEAVRVSVDRETREHIALRGTQGLMMTKWFATQHGLSYRENV